MYYKGHLRALHEDPSYIRNLLPQTLKCDPTPQYLEFTNAAQISESIRACADPARSCICPPLQSGIDTSHSGCERLV